MQFCSNLYRDINFEPDCVQPCCDVHGVKVPSFPFTGGKLDMLAYTKYIDDIVQGLQHEDNKICKNCPQLVEISDSFLAERERERPLQFKTVSINVNRYVCNCKCVYCNLWSVKDGNPGYPILPAIQGLYEQNALDAKCSFSWGGGEPSILSDFEEASLWITQHGYWQYVHTSCLKFSPAIAHLLYKGVGGINVSLDSSCPETYQRVKGLNGFSLVCKNLEKYASVAKNIANVDIKYIIFEENNSIEEIDNFLKYCKSLGIINIQYSFNFKEVNAKGPSHKTLLAAAYFKAKSSQLGLHARPFFITPKWQAIIDTIEVNG